MLVLEKIFTLLNERGVKYSTEHHAPTVTSEEASKIRGVSMHAGAKALVIKGNKTGQHWLFVMPADLRFDTKKAQVIVGERVSFATEPEAVTGCVKGSVPPLGSVIGLKTYCDKRLAENETIHFNAGSLTDSVSMAYNDYVQIEQPQLVDVTQYMNDVVFDASSELLQNPYRTKNNGIGYRYIVNGKILLVECTQELCKDSDGIVDDMERRGLIESFLINLQIIPPSPLMFTHDNKHLLLDYVKSK